MKFNTSPTILIKMLSSFIFEALYELKHVRGGIIKFVH